MLLIYFSGDNLLALARGFGNSPLLSDPGEYKHGKLVFIDILGLKMIIYPHNVGRIINLITVAAALIGIGKKIIGPHTGKFPGWLADKFTAPVHYFCKKPLIQLSVLM